MRIGISIGDPNGIGPEIAIKAAQSKQIRRLCEVVLIGEQSVLEQTAKRLRLKARFSNWADPCLAGIPVMECVLEKPTQIRWGKIDPAAGAASIGYVCLGGTLALQKKIDALVTCPISKEAIIESGVSDFTGHTEYLVELTGATDYTLCLWHGNFRVAHATCHVSLRQAIELCQRDRIVRTARLLHQALQAAGIKSPRIGIAGLNPHAGEHGAFGYEEAKEIVPAVSRLRKNGLRVDGPVPGDVVFARMKGGIYDGVVAMYHDQGHAATKTLFFTLGGKGKSKVGGVNVTLGLPIIRTSVDHGTSFDIAGKGIADPTSLMDAVALAVAFAKRRKNYV